MLTTFFLVWGAMWAIYFVLDGFDLGAGGMILRVAKSPEDRKTIVNSVGPVWDGNEVWLIAAGAFTFGAFPIAYAAMFSTLYTPLMLLLFALIMRGVSFEFRGKFSDAGAGLMWDRVLAISSLLAALLLGVAFANLFRGIPVEILPADAAGLTPLAVGADGTGYIYSGTLSLFNGYGLLGGVLFVVMFLLHGALWIAKKTTGELHDRSAACARRLWFVVAVVTVSFLVYTWFDTQLFDNYLANPVLFILPVCAVVGLVGMLVNILKNDHVKAWFFSAGFILFVAVFGVVGLYPNIFPYRFEGKLLADASLSLFNAASTPRTLVIMLIIAAVILPIVVLYQIWAYRLFWGKLKASDFEGRQSY